MSAAEMRPLMVVSSAMIGALIVKAIVPVTVSNMQVSKIEVGYHDPSFARMTESFKVPTMTPGLKTDAAQRETSLSEQIIGEIREWSSLENNWDGEGAASPISASMREIVSFVSGLDLRKTVTPSPMLLPTGRSALFWDEEGLRADIEFLGDKRIAYYIRNRDGKLKGVTKFDGVSIPSFLKTLLEESSNAGSMVA